MSVALEGPDGWWVLLLPDGRNDMIIAAVEEDSDDPVD
jgi:hypothetical protein